MLLTEKQKKEKRTKKVVKKIFYIFMGIISMLCGGFVALAPILFKEYKDLSPNEGLFFFASEIMCYALAVFLFIKSEKE